MENAIVIAVVIAAGWFLIRTFRKQSSEGCKCTGDKRCCDKNKSNENIENK